MAWLDTHPPASSQFRRPRREAPSGVVCVHTAENTPDFVAFDGGAEAVANFVRTRSDPGSYHDLVDSDSCINLVAYDCEAYHDGTGSNRHSYGVSVATRADVWPLAPKAWRDGAVHQAAAAAARYARWLRDRRGILIPARRINRVESEMRIPGFISHAERDPARRTDPGRSFPWPQFLAHYEHLTADLRPQAPVPEPTPEPLEEDPMWFARQKDTGAVLHLLPTHDPERPLVTMKVDGESWGPPEGALVWGVSKAKFDYLNTLRVDG
ncbi:MAG TPA: N-acetylmuramoyl-L-alanine amidase [Acidimicrobiales bacterium]|nr:N-acetylmuramoyl-L-alanine amidase [Acidimicrobiales bacterium]